MSQGEENRGSLISVPLALRASLQASRDVKSIAAGPLRSSGLPSEPRKGVVFRVHAKGVVLCERMRP